MSVVKLVPVTAGEGFRLNADELLDAAKGKSFKIVAVIGQLEDGTLWTTGSANSGETLVLMELVKHKIVFGDSS